MNSLKVKNKTKKIVFYFQKEKTHTKIYIIFLGIFLGYLWGFFKRGGGLGDL